MMKFFKNYIGGQNSLKGASLILIITLFLSNILGVVRDHYLAQKIPTSLLDTYYAAFRLPDLIFNLMILGAITSAFIPVFTSYIWQNRTKDGWYVANVFLNMALIAVILACIILFIIMPYLVPVLVPKFDLEKQEITLKLSRLMLLSPVFFGFSYIFGGIFNSYKRFLAYSVAPLFYNLSIIVATLFLSGRYSVYGVAFGVVAGAFLHMVVQLPAAYSLGFRWRLVWDPLCQGARRILKLMVPRTIGLASQQLLLLVYTAIGSALGGGAVAIFNLADNIQTMPTVVFGTAFATAVFPLLSETVSLKDDEKFSYYFNRILRTVLFFLIPLSVGMILLRTQIVRLILGSGHFGWEQTILTSQTLGFFAISLVAQGSIPLLARAFYARQNTKTPMTISIISGLLSIIFGYIFAKTLGVAGLALAFSLGSFLNALLLYILFQKDNKTIQASVIFIFVAKVILMSLLMAVAIQLSKYILAPVVDMHRFWGIFVQTFGAATVGILVYFVLAWIFKLKEVRANGQR